MWRLSFSPFWRYAVAIIAYPRYVNLIMCFKDIIAVEGLEYTGEPLASRHHALKLLRDCVHEASEVVIYFV
jgi:hypothetical protein